MAVRLSSTSNYLRRTANLPAASAFTVCGWTQFNDKNDFSAWVGLRGAGGGDELIFVTESNGTEPIIWNGSSQVNSGVNLTPGVPMFFAFTGNAGTAIGYWRQNSNTLSSLTHTAGTFAITELNIGNDLYSEWYDGRFWDVKCWDRALSAAELQVQSFYQAPKFPSSLNFWWLLPTVSDVVDRSGNGRDPTVGGTLATEDASFQPWKPGARVLAQASALSSIPPKIHHLRQQGIA